MAFDDAPPSIELPVIGVDYGAPPRLMLLGSMGFAQCLSDANVVGVAYGPAATDAFGTTIPQLTLIARDGEHLARAFEEFNTWVSQTDGDAVSITVVFRNAGGYVLAISQDVDRLRHRMLKGDTVYDAVYMSTAWFKSIDSVHPMLLELRQYCERFPAPIVLGGAEYSPLKDGPLAEQGSVREVAKLVPVLKFELEFVDEDNVKPNSIGEAAVRYAGEDHASPVVNPQVNPKRDRSAVEIAAKRSATLRRYFPVTIERLRREPRFEALCKQLLTDGFARWQVEQAVCNFILAKEVDLAARRGDHASRPGSKDEDVVTIVCDAVRGRYEMADGKGVPELPAEAIAKQALADGVALLRATGIETPIESAVDLSRALQAAGYASASAVTSVPMAPSDSADV